MLRLLAVELRLLGRECWRGAASHTRGRGLVVTDFVPPARRLCMPLPVEDFQPTRRWRNTGGKLAMRSEVKHSETARHCREGRGSSSPGVILPTWPRHRSVPCRRWRGGLQEVWLLYEHYNTKLALSAAPCLPARARRSAGGLLKLSTRGAIREAEEKPLGEAGRRPFLFAVAVLLLYSTALRRRAILVGVWEVWRGWGSL